MSENPQKFVEKYKVISLAFEMGFIIALPLVALLLLGKYLDERLHTNPYLKIAAIVLALSVTILWLTRRFTRILEDMRQDRNN
ncbi:MAG: AtpZ/AtpI family protein [Patescibacteria group bacterium]|nr:AtpZ/AtpI family protein [Patescibacteria group bacterium]